MSDPDFHIENVWNKNMFIHIENISHSSVYIEEKKSAIYVYNT